MLFEEANNIDKSLARNQKIRKKKKTIVNIRNERVGITTDNMNIKKILKENYEQIYVHKFDNLDKVAKPLKVKICLNS